MSAAMTIIAVGGTVLSIVLAFVASAVEAALRSIPLARIRRLKEAGTHGARALARLAERPSHMGATHALVSGIAFAVTSTLWLWVLETLWRGVPVWVDGFASVIVAGVLVFAFGEALPRTLVAANPESLGLSVARAGQLLNAVFYGPARLLSLPWTAATRLITGEHTAEVPWVGDGEEHRAHVEDESQGEPGEDHLHEAVAALEQKVVREVMIPRTDMVGVEDTASVTEVLATIVAAGVSRVPVYHETLDDVRGILYAKDLLPALADPSVERSPLELARPALFVPETKPIEDLLREMRRRTHIAIVADEYGGTAGLVTIEDLLEEIVGEIFDEYDPMVSMVTTLTDGRVLIDARLAVDELDERFGTALDMEADTAGGVFTELAGHIPDVGESVEVQGLRLTVEDMEGTRIRHLIVEPSEAAHEEGDEE